MDKNGAPINVPGSSKLLTCDGKFGREIAGAGPQGVRPGSLAAPEAAGRDSRWPRHRVARQALAGL